MEYKQYRETVAEMLRKQFVEDQLETDDDRLLREVGIFDTYDTNLLFDNCSTIINLFEIPFTGTTDRDREFVGAIKMQRLIDYEVPTDEMISLGELLLTFAQISHDLMGGKEVYWAQLLLRGIEVPSTLRWTSNLFAYCEAMKPYSQGFETFWHMGTNAVCTDFEDYTAQVSENIREYYRGKLSLWDLDLIKTRLKAIWNSMVSPEKPAE